MSEQQAVYTILAQADAEEEDRVYELAIQALGAFLQDDLSTRAVSRAICDVWPILQISLQMSEKTKQQETTERHAEVRQNWRRISKRELGVDLERPAPPVHQVKPITHTGPLTVGADKTLRAQMRTVVGQEPDKCPDNRDIPIS